MSEPYPHLKPKPIVPVGVLAQILGVSPREIRRALRENPSLGRGRIDAVPEYNIVALKRLIGVAKGV